MNGPKAKITEIFSSVQGEGIFVGARQIFIRFGGCNMSCEFCDTPNDIIAKEYSCASMLNEVKSIEAKDGPHHSISLTGGEPLLQVEFLKVFLPALKKAGFKTYLETNGTLPEALGEIIDFIDIVAMDFKLPSSTGGKALWDEHANFLKIATTKKVFIKSVVTNDTKKEDMIEAIELIKTVNKKIPFIMQPATPFKSFDKKPGENRLLEFLDMALKNDIENSRIIPQMHKIIGVK